MKFLVAEDDLTSQVFLKRVLDPYGQCDIAGDGKEALEKFRSALSSGERYNLILLDIKMPYLTGQEALHQIRNLERKSGVSPSDAVPVFMITGFSDDENVFEAHVEGIAAYITKPLDISELLEKMRKVGVIKDII